MRSRLNAHLLGSAWHQWLVEPRRPPVVRRSSHAHWLVVFTVCIGAFMGQLDASIVTLALPAIGRDFHASIGAVEWVALAYLLVLVATVTPLGRLADMFGRKLLYTYGFAVFIVGSALCGLAPSLGFLIAARVVQALGAAMLQANSVALIAAAVPPRLLGRGIGAQGTAQAAGLALGPAVGGALIALGNWRLIFYVNVPAGIIGMVLGWFLLPRTRDLGPRTGFDWPGALLLAGAAAALMAALSLGSRPGLAYGAVVCLVVATFVLGLGFLARERRTRSALVDLGLFRQLSFSAGIASALLSYLVMFGVLFVVPFFLSFGHVAAAEAGLRLTLLPAALGLCAPLGGRLADLAGPRLPTVGGLLVAGGGLGLLALGHEGWQLTVALCVIGAGLGLFTPANNAAIMATAPRFSSGVAAGLLNMTRALGTALGVAVTTLVFMAVAGNGLSQSATAQSASAKGLSASAWVLTGACVLAAVLSNLRPSRTDRGSTIGRSDFTRGSAT